MEQQLTVMLEMQDSMNRQVHSEWRSQGFAWYRALWLECGELIDHYGYKWWKKQTPDLPQVQLEVVDIWHFGLSMLFDGRAPAQIARDLSVQMQVNDVPERGVVVAAEELARQTLVTRHFPVTAFISLMNACELDFDQLFLSYVGKNVLNRFRQDHGYQQGSYRKLWAGREDNEHLLKVIEQLDTGAADFAGQLYDALNTRYSALEQGGDLPEPL